MTIKWEMNTESGEQRKEEEEEKHVEKEKQKRNPTCSQDGFQ